VNSPHGHRIEMNTSSLSTAVATQLAHARSEQGTPPENVAQRTNEHEAEILWDASRSSNWIMSEFLWLSSRARDGVENELCFAIFCSLRHIFWDLEPMRIHA
jgi:hypothetical protein